MLRTGAGFGMDPGPVWTMVRLSIYRGSVSTKIFEFFHFNSKKVDVDAKAKTSIEITYV